ncbi:MAG: hypothetical protein E3K32_10050 [wastewater metagenome]|nr:hypothetical protein [Candidatus Loosdrechtia aerotolerans]
MTNSLLTFHPEWNEGFQDGTLYSVTLSGAKGLILDERDSFLHEIVILCIIIGYMPEAGCPGCTTLPRSVLCKSPPKAVSSLYRNFHFM